MPTFGAMSALRLATCDERLQRLFNEVIKHVDCTITCGHRGKEEQDEAFRTGKSKVQFPNSMHNKTPSLAVDVVPYPVEWPDARMDRETYARSLGRFYLFVGYVRATADQFGIQVRCGADWDGDFEVKDQNFHDLPHIELIVKEPNGNQP